MNLATEFTELFEKIADCPDGAVMLTPNKRLSRFLHDSYNQHQRQKQRRAWPTLRALSLQAWVQQHWEALSFNAFAPPDSGLRDQVSALLKRNPLSHFQEQVLWQQVVSNHPETPPLLSSKATAALAMDAWQRLQHWQLSPPEDEDSNLNLFLAWCQAFSAECSKRNVVSSSQQAAVVREGLHCNQISAPAWLVLYGFDEQSPQLRHLVSTLRALGSRVEEFTWGRRAERQQRHQFNSEKSEIEASALWAKQRLQRQHNARIAIVVPKLAQLRSTIEQVFTRVFEAQYILPEQAQHAPGFNISAGQNLDSLPLVAAALNALACNAQLLDIEDISRLLRSPFIGDLEELGLRAQLDLSLREQDLRLQLSQVIAAAQAVPAPPASSAAADGDILPRCPALLDSLRQFMHIAQNMDRRQLPSQWAEVFHRQLQALGWPGQRQLDTLEFQQRQRWHEALGEMAMLDSVSDALSWHQALQYLRSLLQQTSFQAQTSSSPVQILGVLEAASLPFDCLWLMNMDDETWPPSPNPNPLLPLPFQIKHNMPQSSPQKELSYAQRLVERFQHSAHELVYSHSYQQDDKQLRASALVASVALQPFEIPAPPSMAEQLFATHNLETSLDNCGPKIVDPSNIRGGSAIIKDQSACPFQAFARHRLHARPLPKISMGLGAKERGILVHHILELIWKDLRSQQKLLQQTDQQLEQLIQSSIDKALRALALPHSVGKRFLRIEAQRLSRQVRAWLELEKQRDPFIVVSNEGRKAAKLGKLPLTLRYDRIDRLEDGGLLVLDYKTGRQELRAWASSRPDEPQVPLYCVLNSKKVAAAAFGQIAADEIAFKGIANDEGTAPGLKTPDMLFKIDLPDTWPAIIAHWEQVLEQLARDFMAGAAAVDPKHPATTCRFCELQPLCRIKEHLNPDSDEDSGAPDDSEDLLERVNLD